ncbi:isoprenylcysteine carboxylmethyltransferase family protein [Pseudoxanthomonas sp. Root630]|uniref:methyltransferase family protein n=1 Tax=Pseudoxanthomonas sp. Root630 TaxID=1736574 RepID=UPI00070355AB|nr:isoprenylcysteine carboxylmethyltransferase family protein [Pseudoxanthomonas sp. Root630]KRA50852.1 isoprenylcysteine carboxyl methyltransferase [Pseudoxanthomonas sp. Root630]
MTQYLISIAFKIIWGSVGLFWLWSARNVKRSSRTEPVLLQLFVYWTPLVVAFVLLGPGDWFEGSFLRERFVPKAVWVKGLGLALAVSGAGLACWSRHLLGRNWSSVVQLKHDHELVDVGPYRYVRHPIYTGLLLAFLGTALKVGDWRGLVAVAIVLASFWRKLGVEERWLSEKFGHVYTAYKRRTKALIPGVV